MWFIILSFFLSKGLAALPELPLVNGGLDRSQVEQGMIAEMYGSWPEDSLRALTERLTLDLPNLHSTYIEWQLVSPRDSRKVLRLGLFLPNDVSAPLTILTLNKCGNHSLLADEGIPLGSQSFQHSVHCKDVRRGSHADKYGVAYLLSQGLAVATFAEADMDADSPSLKGEGIKDLYAHDWGTLAAWAWGLSESSKILRTTGLVGKVFTTGHSRRGKAGLLAAALDQEIAGTFPHQSGLGGTASLRGAMFRESAHMITDGGWWYPMMGEPEGLTHFFNPKFKTKAQQPKKLPYDAHHLIGLVAPRVLIDFQGKKDFWAGPKSAVEMLTAASPLWGMSEVDPIDYKKLKCPIPDLAQIMFPWNHKQDLAFWETLVSVLKQKDLL